MRKVLLTAVIAWKDFLREPLLSACSILGLAAVLTPLLILFGIKHGVISTMTQRLLSDPRNLEIIPIGSGNYGPSWFADLLNNSDVGFILPQTRSIAATLDLRHDERHKQLTTVSMAATAPGDPLLLHWGISYEIWKSANGGNAVPIVLSASAARKVGAKQSDVIAGSVERRRDDRIEKSETPLVISAVLPLYVQQKDVAYVPLQLLIATEDFRDGLADSIRDGESSLLAEKYLAREFASFRLYAKDLDSVEKLQAHFHAKQIEVHTRAEEIELVRNLDTSLTAIFFIITGASIFGFAASTASNSLAGVKRKSRSFGIISLLGFPKTAILLYPIAQAIFIGIGGTLLAGVLYLCVAKIINHLFITSVHQGESVCSLTLPHFFTALSIVLLFSMLSALMAAVKATVIEPSEVIRDV